MSSLLFCTGPEGTTGVAVGVAGGRLEPLMLRKKSSSPRTFAGGTTGAGAATEAGAGAGAGISNDRRSACIRHHTVDKGGKLQLQ